MSDLRELYQEVILDHNKEPRNFGALPRAERLAEGYNPLCGDRVKVYLAMDGERISDIRFEGAGCAISTASASMMTEAVKGKTAAEAEALFGEFHRLVTAGGGTTARETAPALGKLVVFAGVWEFPIRVKCATLAWHTLQAAIRDRQERVSTE